MVNLHKVAILEQDIEIAYSQGLWPLVLSLVDKYKTKYFPHGNVFEYLALAKVLLSEELDACLMEISFDCIPNGQLELKTSGSGKLDQARTLLEQCIQEEKNDENIILLFMALVKLLENNIDQTTLKVLERVPLNEESFSQPVCFVLSVVLRVIYHQCQGQGETVGALLETNLVQILNFKRTRTPTIKSSKAAPFSTQISDQFVVWKEFFLFLYIFNQAKDYQLYIAQYLDLVESLPRKTLFLVRKTVVQRVAIDKISSKLSHEPCFKAEMTRILNEPFDCNYKELEPLLLSYRSTLLELHPFPMGSSITEQDKCRYEHVLNMFESLFTLKSHQSTPQETPQEMVSRHYQILKDLSLATKHTFLSLRIARMSVFAWYSLIKIAGHQIPLIDRKEACNTFEYYVSLLEKRCQSALEDKSKADNVSESAVELTKVDGESIEDSARVFVMGCRLLLRTANGDSQQIEKALGWMRFIRVYTERNTRSSAASQEQTTKLLLAAIDETLCLCLTEYALEVCDSSQRRSCQSEALDIYKQLTSDTTPSSQLLYQYALLLCEIGQIDEAILTVNSCLSAELNHAPAWTLLMICLSCKKDFDAALTVFNSSWKESISYAVNTFGIRSPSSTVDSLQETEYNSWTQLDVEPRLDLFNLKFTQFLIEIERFGHKVALNSLGDLFVLFKKLFGLIGQNPSSKQAQQSQQHDSQPQHVHDIRTLETLLGLWLIASMIYRLTADEANARGALSEAKLVLKQLATSASAVFFSSSSLAEQVEAELQTEPLGEYLRSFETVLKFEEIMLNVDQKHFEAHVKAQHGLVIEYPSTLQPKSNAMKVVGNSLFKLQTGVGSYTSVVSFNSTKDNVPDGPATSKCEDLDDIIYQLEALVISDEQFVPASICLAQLLLAQGKRIQYAESLLERVIKRSKARGQSLGFNYCHSLVSTGLTSAWGWRAWYSLAQTMRTQEKSLKAAECIMFGVRLMQCTGVRGFECLQRF